jgi:nitrogen fixation NifU-like protein
VDSPFYREQILEHARHPRNSGRLDPADARAEITNALCGDRLEVTLNLSQGSIRELRFLVRGCSIAQASASMLSELLEGVELSRLGELGRAFRAMMQDGAPLPPMLASMAPLAVVRQHRSRVRCALLPWEALEACAAAPQRNSPQP